MDCKRFFVFLLLFFYTNYVHNPTITGFTTFEVKRFGKDLFSLLKKMHEIPI